MMTQEYARERLTQINSLYQRINGELTLESRKLSVLAAAYELALCEDSDRDSLERILLARVNGAIYLAKLKDIKPEAA